MRRFWCIIIVLLVILTILLVFLGFWYKLQPDSFKSNIKRVTILNSVARQAFSVWQDFRDPLREIKQRAGQDEPVEVFIRVNPEKVFDKITPFWSGIGEDLFYNHAASLDSRLFYEFIGRMNLQRSIVHYWRSHNLLSDREAPWGLLSGGKVYTENEFGKPVYNWERIDQVFDLVVNAGLVPIVELGFMPEQLSSNPDHYGDWGAANVAPPKDYGKWQQLVRVTTRHLIERYGDQTLNWFFEVWNEPDLYYFFWIESSKKANESDIEEYNKLYDFTVQGVLEADPRLKVGGPAIAGWGNILKAFLRHIDSGINYANGKTGSRLDFISFHRYGRIYEDVISGAKRLIDVVLDINHESFSKLPIFIDEYGPTTTSKEDWKNTPYVSTWLAATISGFCWLADQCGPNYLPSGMVFWAGIGRNFAEGSGIVGTTVEVQDQLFFLRGPVLNAFDLLSYLGPSRIELKGQKFGDATAGIATKNDKNEIAVLVYRLGGESAVSSDSVLVSLNVAPLADGKYHIRHFRIDQKHSNPYFYFCQRQGNLTLADLPELQEQNKLQELRPPLLHYLGGQYETNFSMPVNSVSLLLLTPESASFSAH